MPFIGNTPDVNFTSFAKQDLTGVTGSPAKTGFTLTHAVANANEIEVFVNNVRQEPTEAYTVNGTGLTMTGDVETTDDFYIIYLGKALQTTVPPDGTAKIADVQLVQLKYLQRLQMVQLVLQRLLIVQ
jgi:sRNA-binding regulator protein Hfq